ncbi:carboxy terminal-processing peptidase [Accumulibacter sp.]|uniref:carboxy terminal-processing peptidase n=1 Tax=Accumulibacter sp. TaxID=2053492 RepID=UPI00263A37F3|nr:carboxy terminal-processing peptidase [Accumulibacter sp.]
MTKRALWLLVAWLVAAQAFARAPQGADMALLAPLPQQTQSALWSAQVLSRYHYRAAPLDDAMSERIFANYVEALDGEKNFFLQSDIDRFAGARTKLDDAILEQDLSIPFALFNLQRQRLAERVAYARELLKQKPDFTVKEGYPLSRKKAPWAKNEDEIRDLWRKRVKNDWLRLKLAGKDDAAIRATLDKRYENYLTRNVRMKSEDAFQVFMNAYSTAMDPHTSYLGPRAAEDFDISMRLSLVGIGAVLQERDEYTTIRELVPGGPAALSGRLKVGDRIIGVGQGARAPVTDVLGWRIDDVVALIRGEKDTTVLLSVLPADAGPDGRPTLISLTRAKINIAAQAAKKSIIEARDGTTKRRIGVISLPTFYEDFDARRKGDANYKSATRDVARLLAELKKENVDGVVLDLRDNGGGSLSEAVDLTGLFIDTGPVVQQRNAQGQVRIENDVHSGFAWTGPLAVLINRRSASASEIVAAAIQDYGRGLVIGETSYGKGTVQAMVDLNQIAKEEKARLGELKMTIAQFFRVSGGTTQLRGVSPDITLPSMTDPEEFGESSSENALPWTQIRAADFAPAGRVSALLPALRARHEVRVAKDRDFQYLLEDVAEFNALRKKNEISLNEAERRAERDRQEARQKLRAGKNEAGVRKASRQDDGLLASERALSADLAEEKENKKAKDVLLIESANILSDEIGLLKADTRLSAQVLPAANAAATRTR